MIDFLLAHQTVIVATIVALWARFRHTMPPMGAKPFYRRWAYDFVQGTPTKPPV